METRPGSADFDEWLNSLEFPFDLDLLEVMENSHRQLVEELGPVDALGLIVADWAVMAATLTKGLAESQKSVTAEIAPAQVFRLRLQFMAFLLRALEHEADTVIAQGAGDSLVETIGGPALAEMVRCSERDLPLHPLRDLGASMIEAAETAMYVDFGTYAESTAVFHGAASFEDQETHVGRLCANVARLLATDDPVLRIVVGRAGLVPLTVASPPLTHRMIQLYLTLVRGEQQES